MASSRLLRPRRQRWRARKFVIMTSYSHNMVMKHVRIAELKARLSEYLRTVRRGETIAVFDRDTPVAQIVPFRERPTLRVRKPSPAAPPLNRVRRPKPLKLNVDVVQLLLEERQGHR
jgi:prevent-host-death family protein